MATSLQSSPTLRSTPLDLRMGQWIVTLLPAVTALVFVPALASPFLIPKLCVAFAGMGACFALAAPYLSWKQSSDRPVRLALLACAAWLLLQWAVSPLRYMGWMTLLLLLGAMALFEAARVLLCGVEGRLISAVSSAAGIVSLLAIAQFSARLDPFTVFGMASTQTGRMRVFATLGNPDFTGTFLAASLPAICALPRSTMRFAVLALTLVGIVCTGSRAALLAAGVALVIHLLLSWQTSRARKALISAAVVLSVAGAIAGIAQWNGRSIETATQGRLTIWKASLHRAAWSGYGIGTFAYVYLPKAGVAMRDGVALDARFVSAERHAQNDLVEVIVEQGYFGAALVLLFLAMWFRSVWLSGSRHRALSIATVGALLTAAMFDFPMHRGETIVIMAVFLALPLVHSEHASETRLRTGRAALSVVIAVLVAAVSAAPIISSRFTRLGREAEAQGDFSAATRDYQRALLLWRDNTDAWFALPRALARGENYKDALFWSNEATRYIAEPELWVLRARILESMGRDDDALREMEHASAMFPFSVLPAKEIEAIRQPKQQ